MATTTRRDALKYIGLGFGGVAIAPAVLLQACREAAKDPAYTYSTLSPRQATALRLIQDTILPKTESSPSASEVGSVAYADTYLTYGYKPEDKAQFLHQLDRFDAKLKEGGADLDSATPEQVEAMFKTYFVDYKEPEAPAAGGSVTIEGNTVKTPATEDDEAGTPKITENLNANEQTEAPVPQYGDDSSEINKLLKGLRSMTLESYFQSEIVGETVLNYQEVPGKWVGQMPISELPKGRAWSL